MNYTIKRVPSSVSHNNASEVVNEQNMLTDVTSSTYGYAYGNSRMLPIFDFSLKFEFPEFPDGAIIKSIRAQVKCKQTNLSNKMYLYPGIKYNNIMDTDGSISSTVAVHDFVLTHPDRLNTITNKPIMNMTYRYQTGNTGYLYIYGAFIEITYCVPEAYVKVGNEWKGIEEGYEKVNGVWVSKPVSELFNSNKHYEKGEL